MKRRPKQTKTTGKPRNAAQQSEQAAQAKQSGRRGDTARAGIFGSAGFGKAVFGFQADSEDRAKGEEARARPDGPSQSGLGRIG